MSLTIGRPNAGDTAFTVAQTSECNANPARNPSSDFTNVTLRGENGYDGSYHWGTGINVVDVSVINFTNVGYFGGLGQRGYGINLTGFDAFGPCQGNPAFGVVYNFYGCTFEAFDAGIVYGTGIQGVAIVSCNFTNGNLGVFCPLGVLNVDQLSVTTSQFGSLNNAILLQAKLNSTTSLGDLFVVASDQNGIVLNSDSSCVTGNVFAGTGPSNNNGVYIVDSIQCVVTGNAFSDLTTGVALTPGASGVNIQSNSYRSVSNPFFNNDGAGDVVRGGSP